MSNLTLFVSVIIPVLNDEGPLRELLGAFPAHESAEIVVVDGGSRGPEMSRLAEQFPLHRWVRSQPGRARQLNVGARLAKGKWLLFLHADTRLPINWMAELRRADAIADAVAGCFRFALDSRDWRARVLERGVALRVRLFGLPYGDQALFVRRDVFERLGGHADIPLMEDVEFVRRLRREGRLWCSAAPAVTSDRRWRREGWFRRSTGNLWLLLQYFAGVPAGRLAAKYYGNPAPAARDAVVGIMARAPSDRDGKTRLVAGLSSDKATALRRALFLDTLAGVSEASEDVGLAVLYSPPEASREFEMLVPDATLLPQSGADLGDRMYRGMLALFSRGYTIAILVGSDLPGLPAAVVHEAVNSLRQNLADVVLGPTEDGGYYLIGLREPHEGLFRGIEWSAATVFAHTAAAAQRLRLRLHVLPKVRDVDTQDDLAAIASGSAVDLTNVRAWLHQNS